MPLKCPTHDVMVKQVWSNGKGDSINWCPTGGCMVYAYAESPDIRAEYPKEMTNPGPTVIHKSSKRYLVTFYLYGQDKDAYLPEPWGIPDIRDGFWVNEEYEITSGSDAKYWIPPSQIMAVRKT